MKITRKWAIPNKHTFSIKPIRELIEGYTKGRDIIIDPFANQSRIANITNDLDTDYDTDYNVGALEFLKMFDNQSVDMVLYDLPYTVRQVSECYKKMGHAVNMQTTQASYWSKQKEEIKRIVKRDGIVISLGYNSNGVGKTRGFEIVEILLVPHGGPHHDTIVTVERKK